jgi:hypothetical protein
MALCEAEGARAFNLNALTEGKNFPYVDLTTSEGITQVKAYGIDKGLSGSVLSSIDRDLRILIDPTNASSISEGLRAADKAGSQLVSNRVAIEAAGAWPRGLAGASTKEEVLQFIHGNATLAIPDDLVPSARNYVAEYARQVPERYGLQSSTDLDGDIARLVGRIQPIGLTSSEMRELELLYRK